MVAEREALMRTFFRRLFLLLFLLDAACCCVLTPWMGWVMHVRIEDSVAAGMVAASWLDWACPLVWASYGPLCLAVGIGTVRRAWSPAT